MTAKIPPVIAVRNVRTGGEEERRTLLSFNMQKLRYENMDMLEREKLTVLEDSKGRRRNA
jgi:hypothetical protein